MLGKSRESHSGRRNTKTKGHCSVILIADDHEYPSHSRSHFPNTYNETCGYGMFPIADLSLMLYMGLRDYLYVRASIPSLFPSLCSGSRTLSGDECYGAR